MLNAGDPLKMGDGGPQGERIARIIPSGANTDIMVACAGPLATIGCEPRQARKGAAAAADSCAGVWLVQVATLYNALHQLDS